MHFGLENTSRHTEWGSPGIGPLSVYLSSVSSFCSSFSRFNSIFFVFHILLKCIGVFSAVVGCLRGFGPRDDVPLLRPEVPSHDPSVLGSPRSSAPSPNGDAVPRQANAARYGTSPGVVACGVRCGLAPRLARPWRWVRSWWWCQNTSVSGLEPTTIGCGCRSHLLVSNYFGAY